MNESKIVYDLADVLKEPSEPVPFLIERLFPENSLAMLAGAGKSGKSWLALHLAAAVSNGLPVLGSFKSHKKKVLYLGLEDSITRIKSRIQKMRYDQEIVSGNFLVSTRWTTSGQALLDLREYITKNGIGFCIIDTWQRFAVLENGNDYSEVTTMAGTLQQIAQDTHCSILIVHHVKKGEETDFTLRALGSVGLVGAMDEVLILDRPRNGTSGKLSITGRDVEEMELDLTLDPSSMKWATPKLRSYEEYPELSER